MHYTTSCKTQFSAPEDGRNNSPKHAELIGIINKPLLLHLHCGDPDVDGKIILRWIFRKWEGVETGWSWLRIGTGGGHL